MNKKAIALLFSAMTISSLAIAENWEEEWDKQKESVIKRCKSSLGEYPYGTKAILQCFYSEEEAFINLHNGYNIPPEYENEAKSYCFEKFSSYVDRDICMKKIANNKMLKLGD